jgi:IgGFc binding protein
MIRLPLRSVSSIAAILVVGACASTEEPGDRAPPPPLVDECAPRCSADGHSIVDCRGAVLDACTAYASCVDAKCVDACSAAMDAQSSVGCEYFAAKPSAYLFANDASKNDASCYAVLVANTWNAPVELAVEYDGQPISPSYFRIPRGRGQDISYELLPEGKLPSGELAVLFLAMEPKAPISEEASLYVPCPAAVGAGVLHSAAVRGNGLGKMFHIRTTAPVTAYDIYPYGGARSFYPSSSLLLPTSAWGTESLAMDGYSVDEAGVSAGKITWFQVLASQDETHVKIRPTATLASTLGKPPLPAGEVGEFVLQRGQFLQFSQIDEVNGSGVESDKPVSLVGGASCATIPTNVGYCDTLHQQLPPIRLFGDAYVATRFRDRGEPETTPWRILAAADGTQLTYNPPIPGAPTTLDRGQWKEFSAPGPFVVRSQDKAHPIYVAAYMTGAANVSSGEGDPEMVNVVPIEQYLSSYVFLTDPTYGNTNLVFVRSAVDGTYEDVELDCVGAVQGWQKVGSTNYEVAYVDLVRKGAAQGTCDNGVHRASSKRPFALTVWGWDSAASYGYPAGMGTKTLNDITAIR